MNKEERIKNFMDKMIDTLELEAATIAAFEDEAAYNGTPPPDEHLYDRVMGIKNLFENKKCEEGLMNFVMYLHDENIHIQRVDINVLKEMACLLGVDSKDIDSLISLEESV